MQGFIHRNGLADIRHLKEQQFERPLSDHGDAIKVLNELATEAKEQVTLQGIAPMISMLNTAHICALKDRISPLKLTWNARRVRIALTETARYGFSAGAKDDFEALAVEAIGGASEITEENIPTLKNLQSLKTALTSR